MQIQDNSLANITTVVNDHFFIEIKNQPLAGSTFEYKICTHDEKIIRKGQFSGPYVQLRLSLIEEGQYIFLLYLNGQKLQESSFEKRSNCYLALVK